MACKKLIEFAIDLEDVWADDVLGRQLVAEKFTNLISTIHEPFVISVNSPYGTGKSFFLNRWYRSLNPENFAAFFYNAWQTDFHEHAFIPFVYSLINQMKQSKFITIDTELFNNFQHITEKLITLVVDQTLSRVSNDLLTVEKGKQVLNTGVVASGGEIFNSFSKRQNLLFEFKERLSAIVEQLNQTGQKLVIFIDELERCRPTYAVELLESIKHLFDINGITFILGIDRSQLKHTIANLYGSGMNAEGYLRRFIDLELTLPEPSSDLYIKYLYNYFQFDEVLKLADNYYVGGETLITYMGVTSSLFKLSLRDIAQCFTELNVVIRSLNANQAFLPVLLSLLVCLRRSDQGLYNLLGQAKIEQVSESFQQILSGSFIKEKHLEVLNCFFYIGLDNREINYIDKRMQMLSEVLDGRRGDTRTKASVEREFRMLQRAKAIQNDLQGRYGWGEYGAIVNDLKQYLSFC